MGQDIINLKARVEEVIISIKKNPTHFNESDVTIYKMRY